MAICQQAIEAEIVHEKSKITFKEIFKIAEAAIKIYMAFYDGKVLILLEAYKWLQATANQPLTK